jgi:hypothetical protein
MSEQPFVGEELTKAREARTDATLLLERGGTDEGVVNRLYYAAFHAAQAALYKAGSNRIHMVQFETSSARNLFSMDQRRENRVDSSLPSRTYVSGQITGTTR